MKIGMVSLGCAKNQVDAEIMLGNLIMSNHTIVADPDDAEAIIVNTCAFIESAKEEAINTILEMASKKITGNLKYLIVTGCLAQRYADEIQKDIPEVDGILGISGFDRINDCIAELARKDQKYVYNGYSKSLTYLNSKRVLTTPKGAAYIKIAEGCDNRCAYCAIPQIRGSFRSRRIEDILEEAKSLVKEGAKELILIAQDSTRYGLDIYGQPSLTNLLRELNKIEDLYMIRVMYLYPDEITTELIDAMKSCEKVAHYVDLPLQHISDRVLQTMNRRGKSSEIKDIIARFKKEIPDLIIRTSLIVGFPGETEEEFEELCEFIRETRFDRVGIFAYSKEEGTKASKMKPQISKKIKEERKEKLMTIQQAISYENNQNRVGKTYDTLVEGVAEDGIFYYGRTYGESPEVDGYVYFTSPEPLNEGDIVKVKILIAEEYDLTGEAVM